MTFAVLRVSFAFPPSFNFDAFPFIRPDDAAGREKKYFWRVYDKARGAIAFYIDGKDTSRANWMRYVLPAYRRSVQVRSVSGVESFWATLDYILLEETW